MTNEPSRAAISTFVIRHSPRLPIHYRPVVHVIRFAVAPVVIKFAGEGVFIQFDAQAGAGRDVDVAVADLERILDVADAETHLFLAEKIRNGGGKLKSGRQ